MSAKFTLDVEDVEMEDDKIESLYEKRQFSKCINRLIGQIRTCSFTDGLVIRNNLLVTQIQHAHALQDYQLLENHNKSLNQLWLELASLPFCKKVSLLTLSCTSNIVYTFFMLPTPKTDHSKLINLAVKALETLSLQLGKVPICESNSALCRFHQLGKDIVQCGNLSSTELVLILYTAMLLSLIYNDEELILLMKEIIQINNLQPHEVHESNILLLFLLSPVDLPLVTNQPSFQQTICNFSSLIVAVHYCSAYLWKEAEIACKMQNKVMFQLAELIELYSNLCGNIPVNVCKFDEKSESQEFIHFSKCLLHAAVLAKEKKHSMAIEFLRIAIGGALGATKFCCIPVVCSALQFQHLRESELEVQAWTVAEDILFNSPELPCQLHSETLGYLLQQMGLLKIPSVVSVQYRLARSLLENQLHERAVAVYDQLADASNGNTAADDAIAWMELPSLPVTQIISHERVLSLLSAKQFNRALEVIESSAEDFVSLYLHAQIAISMKQKPKAIKLVNRAIQLLSRTSLEPPEMGRILESKLHWKLAVLFNSTGNYQDALHQLRFAVQQNSSDAHLMEYYRSFVAKSGIKIASSESHSAMKEDVNQITEKYLQLNDDWAVRYLLKPLSE